MPTHAPILESHPLHWPDESACANWAGALARRLIDNPALRDGFIELHGDLGAGKTTLVRHLLRGLGHQGRVKSPTYTVMEPYDLLMPDGQPLAVAHLDLYRLADPREVIDAGLQDTLRAPGLKLVEWPDHAAGLLGTADLALHLTVGADDSRQVQVQAHSARGRALAG